MSARSPFDAKQKPNATSARTSSREVWIVTPYGWAMTSTDLPTVTVLVPVLNEAAYLPRCLDCIFQQDYPPDLIEVLVIDGGSTDGSREIVTLYRYQHPNLRLLVNPEGWISYALNRGIQAATGEIVVRVDAHTFIAPDYIRRCVAALRTGKVTAVGGTFQPIGETLTGRAIAAVIAHPLGGGPAPFRHARRPMWVDTVYLGAWLRDTLHQVGGFNTTLAANEDFELCYRLRRLGGRILCDPAIRSWTVVRQTFRALAQQYGRYGYWKGQMLKQHPRSLRWRQLPAPLLVFTFWLLWLLGWHVPWAAQAAVGVLTAYAGFIALLATEIALRNGWQLWWRVWLAFWIVHWAWGMGFWAGLFTPLPRREADTFRNK